jgi:CRP-like cAMP-binding protein
MNSSLNNREVLKKGEVLFREGEFSDYLYIVDEGEICTFLVSDSRAIPLDLHKTKGLVGENSSHKENMTYTENAVAMCDTKLIKIKISDIQEFLSESDMWVKDILAELAQKIEKTQKSIKEHKVANTNVFKDGFNIEVEKFLIKSL